MRRAGLDVDTVILYLQLDQLHLIYSSFTIEGRVTTDSNPIHPHFDSRRVPPGGDSLTALTLAFALGNAPAILGSRLCARTAHSRRGLRVGAAARRRCRRGGQRPRRLPAPVRGHGDC